MFIPLGKSGYSVVILALKPTLRLYVNGLWLNEFWLFSNFHGDTTSCLRWQMSLSPIPSPSIPHDYNGTGYLLSSTQWFSALLGYLCLIVHSGKLIIMMILTVDNEIYVFCMKIESEMLQNLQFWRHVGMWLNIGKGPFSPLFHWNTSN